MVPGKGRPGRGALLLTRMTDRERRLYGFFAVCAFTEGMSGLAYEPVDYLLKNTLRLGPAQAALFITWMTLPLTIKPVLMTVSCGTSDGSEPSGWMMKVE